MSTRINESLPSGVRPTQYTALPSDEKCGVAPLPSFVTLVLAIGAIHTSVPIWPCDTLNATRRPSGDTDGLE
jgi:hypothetical protein